MLSSAKCHCLCLIFAKVRPVLTKVTDTETDKPIAKNEILQIWLKTDGIVVKDP